MVIKYVSSAESNQRDDKIEIFGQIGIIRSFLFGKWVLMDPQDGSRAVSNQIWWILWVHFQNCRQLWSILWVQKWKWLNLVKSDGIHSHRKYSLHSQNTSIWFYSPLFFRRKSLGKNQYFHCKIAMFCSTYWSQKHCDQTLMKVIERSCCLQHTYI